MKVPDISKEYRVFNIVFTVALVVFAAAPFAITISEVAFSYLPISWAPPACAISKLTGQECPGTGLTRSVVALYHGNWSLSLNYHRGGSFVVGLIFFEILLRPLPWLVKSQWLPWFDLAQLVLVVGLAKYLMG